MRQNQARVRWGDAGVNPHSLPSPRNTHRFLNSTLRARQVGFKSGLELTVCLWTSDRSKPETMEQHFKEKE